MNKYKIGYEPEAYFNYLKDVERNKNFYKNSTYSESYNKRLLKEANNFSFKKFLKNKTNIEFYI
jgi:hypothetical protein